MIFYLFAFIVDPNFREREEKKTSDREKILRQKPSMVEIENQNYHKMKKDRKLYEIENNINIFENCLDDPHYCINNSQLLSKVKDMDRKNSSKTLATNIKTEFNSTYYGCFCREKIDMTIYKNCPIDHQGLDSIWSEHHSCILNLKISWDEFSKCDIEFENRLINLENQNSLIKENALSKEKNEMLNKSKRIRGLLSLRNIYH